MFGNLLLIFGVLFTWRRLKHSISIKIIIILSTMISSSFLYHIVWNLALNVISLDSSFFSRIYKYLSIYKYPICFPIGQFLDFFSLLLDPLINYIQMQNSLIYISIFCTEEGMFIVTETATCNISYFYWCCKRCSLSYYYLRYVD